MTKKVFAMVASMAVVSLAHEMDVQFVCQFLIQLDDPPKLIEFNQMEMSNFAKTYFSMVYAVVLPMAVVHLQMP